MIDKNRSKKTYIITISKGYLVVVVMLVVFIILLQPNVIRSSYSITGVISNIRKESDTYYVLVQWNEHTVPAIVYNKAKLGEKLTVGEQHIFVVRDDVYAFEKKTDIVEIGDEKDVILGQVEYLSILRDEMLVVQIAMVVGTTLYLIFIITLNDKLVKNDFYKKDYSQTELQMSAYKKYNYLLKNKSKLDSKTLALYEIYERYNPAEFEQDDPDSRDLYYFEIARVLVYMEDLKKRGFTTFDEEVINYQKFASYDTCLDDFTDSELDKFKRMSREVIELFYSNSPF